MASAVAYIAELLGSDLLLKGAGGAAFALHNASTWQWWHYIAWVSIILLGMEILSQRNHSLYLRAFQNDPGLDAAVFTPSLDMRWRNDSPFPITVTAAASGGKLVITLWGVSDGRKVVVSDPVYTNRTDPPAPEWRLDSSLGDGVVKWVSRGSGGMVITRTRAVTAPNGHLLHQDTVVSRYTPSTGLALYGPEVTPPGDAPTH